MNKNTLHQIICDSALPYKINMNLFFDKYNKYLEYLNSYAQKETCTEEQKYIIDSLNDWLIIKGYQMLADTVQKMNIDDERKILQFIKFYEFMLQCASGNIEKIIDYLFYVPEQFTQVI